MQSEDSESRYYCTICVLLEGQPSEVYDEQGLLHHLVDVHDGQQVKDAVTLVEALDSDESLRDQADSN